jgi:hypothetical protein
VFPWLQENYVQIAILITGERSPTASVLLKHQSLVGEILRDDFALGLKFFDDARP